jgi:hypothetical protein
LLFGEFTLLLKSTDRNHQSFSRVNMGKWWQMVINFSARLFKLRMDQKHYPCWDKMILPMTSHELLAWFPQMLSIFWIQRVIFLLVQNVGNGGMIQSVTIFIIIPFPHSQP